MKKSNVDWGTWLSMAAIAAVCLGIATQWTVPPKTPVENAEVDEVVSEGEEGAPPTQKDEETQPPAEPRPEGYAVNKPEQGFELDESLGEISGLSVAKDGESLWAVHDERPVLFRLSMKDGSIVQQIDLGKRGDFESVETVGDEVFVGRSDGVVLVVDPSGKKDIEKLSFTTTVGLACDVEGMAYQPAKKRVLMSCKNEGSKTRKSNKAFEVFAIDLATREMAKEPVLVLQEAALDEYIAAHPDATELKRTKGKSFAPSGLAVHPKTGDIYLISTRGKMIVVLDAEGKLTRIDGLDGEVHLQPEGIAIAEDGTMFISNEAHGKRAKLYAVKSP